jgi:hypothetical protein
MDAIGEDQVNWSDIARPAFQTVVAEHEHRKEPTMTTAFERLRVSRERFLRKMNGGGREAGRRWAMNCAEFEDLLLLSANRDAVDEEQAFEILKEAIGERLDDDDVATRIGVKSLQPPPSGAYCDSFIAGALEIFDEINPQLLRLAD